MSIRKTTHMLALGALLAASVPALADHDRRDRGGRHVSHKVVVKHHPHTRRVVVERPAYVERRVVVHRPIYVDRPEPVYQRPYGYESDYGYGHHGPASYPGLRELNTMGTAAGAVIGAVIGSQIGRGHSRGATAAVGAVLGGVIGSQF